MTISNKPTQGLSLLALLFLAPAFAHASASAEADHGHGAAASAPTAAAPAPSVRPSRMPGGAAPGNSGMQGGMQGGMSGHMMMGMGAHGDEHGSAAGSPGDPAQVQRTVKINLGDDMRFEPSSLEVKAGETLRFFLVNGGKLDHEMVIGTAEELAAHAQQMREMPQMVHRDGNMIRLAAGQRGGLVWRFDRPGKVRFACLVPGHMEAGMVGEVLVR